MNRYHSQQDIFDRIVTAVLAQGQRAMAEIAGSKVCRYRGEGGCKCAVGHLIPDNRYREDFEGLTLGRAHGGGDREPYHLMLQAIAEEIGHYVLDDHTMHLLTSLQMAHDRGGTGRWHSVPFRQDFGGRARAVAVLFDLSTIRLDDELAKYTAEQRTPESTL